jgi:hypothetical protein
MVCQHQSVATDATVDSLALAVIELMASGATLDRNGVLIPRCS